MTDVPHPDLSDPDLHEPKGVSTASSGQIYQADGLGSGAWVALPSGAFTVTINEYTTSTTWTRPSNFIGCWVLLVGGGGGNYAGSANGGTGGTSSFGSAVTCLGGGGATSTTNGIASADPGTANFITKQGKAGSGGGASDGVGGRTFAGPYTYECSGTLYGYGGDSSVAASATHSGGGGASKWGWLASGSVNATMAVTVGAGGGSSGSGGEDGRNGVVVVYAYAKV